MSAPIGPGDWVECINAGPCFSYGSPGLSLGSLYCVEAVAANDRVACGFTVWLVGRTHPRSPTGGFGLERFKPIYRPKADLIESLKAPPIRAPSKTREDA